MKYLKPCLRKLGLAVVLSLGILGHWANSVLADTKPNFVLIFADDLGYGDVGCQGGDVPTPHIDSIANGGTVFTDGYVTCPVCAPSRAGLLTGRYQQTFGFWDNIGPYRRNKDVQPGIPVDVPILSERLQKLGYTCGLFGKTHDGDAEELLAFHRWDEFYGFNNGASNYLGDMNRAHNPIFHNRRIVSSPYAERGITHNDVNRNGVLIRDTENYLTDTLGDHAVKFIEANKDHPFLCYIPFNAIHGPFQPRPETLVEKYADQSDPQRRRVMAMLDSMDRNVGKVLQALRRNGLEDNTLIVFLSDNGGHESSPNTPLRGKKGTYWEGGLRVPFCMQWKGNVPAGRTYRQPVISLDLMPTFITAAGGNIDPAWKLDGVDLLPFVGVQASACPNVGVQASACRELPHRPATHALVREAHRDNQPKGCTPTRPHETLYWVWGSKAIRHGDLKALTRDHGQTWQMFDVAQDMAEQHDLAAARPDDLQSLAERHRRWESGLMPQQWGWDQRLGYKDPDFGKPRPYHDPKYFAQ